MQKRYCLVLMVGLLLFPAIAKADTVHVTTSPSNTVQGVIHTAVPVGSNSAGVTWKAALMAAGESGSTSLADSFITTTENNQIVSGDLIEIPFSIVIGEGKVTISPEDVIKIINDKKAELQDRFSHYGKTYN